MLRSDGGAGSYPPPRQRRQQYRADMIDAIVAAAIDQINAEGLAALNLHEVARRVNMSAQALMKYFPSKADLYDALFREAVARLLASDREVWAKTPPDWTRVQAWLAARLAFARQGPGLYDLSIGGAVPGLKPRPESVEFALAVGNAGVAALQEMIDAGVIAARYEPREMMNMLLAVSRGLVAEILDKEPLGLDRERFERLIPDFMAMFRAVWSADAPGSADAPDGDVRRRRAGGGDRLTGGV